MAKMTKKQMRVRRHARLRRKVSGTAAVPRMSVNRTNKHITVQFIDDEAGVTLAGVSTTEKAFEASVNVEGATALGKIAAERAKAKGIEQVVFDRGGFKFHGQVKAVADAARENGLTF